MRFVKPLDAELVLRLAREHELLVTVEENTVQGGAGSAVEECLQQRGVMIPLLQLGLPDRFIEQGEHGAHAGGLRPGCRGIARPDRKQIEPGQ